MLHFLSLKMDSSINNNINSSSRSMHTSIGAIDGFFPTSPHFFDTNNFLDTPAATSRWAQPTPDPTNNLNYPNPTTTTAAKQSSTSAPGPTGRTSKKRSRASRRAPTTVLTTDTSNFRAMVQEFTGIPSPPFTSLRSPLTSFLLRPFQPHPAPASPLPPINMAQQQQQPALPPAAAAASSSGELRLPGVIGSGGGDEARPQQDAIAAAATTTTEFQSEFQYSWICSSD